MKFIDDGRRQFLVVNLDGAVSRDVEDDRVGPSDLGADRGRKPVALRPPSAARDHRPWFHEFIELRGPHLVLADLCRDYRLALRCLPYLLDDVLGPDIAVILVLKRIFPL